MSKHTIIGVIVLMSISLLGVVGLQLYWINNALQVKQEQFDRSVNEALSKVVEKLETHEAVSMVAKAASAITKPDATADTASAAAPVPISQKQTSPQAKRATAPAAASTPQPAPAPSAAAPRQPGALGGAPDPLWKARPKRAAYGDAMAAHQALIANGTYPNVRVVTGDTDSLLAAIYKQKEWSAAAAPAGSLPRFSTVVTIPTDSVNTLTFRSATASPNTTFYRLNPAKQAQSQRQQLRISVDTLRSMALELREMPFLLHATDRQLRDLQAQLRPEDIGAVEVRNDSIFIRQQDGQATVFFSRSDGSGWSRWKDGQKGPALSAARTQAATATALDLGRPVKTVKPLKNTAKANVISDAGKAAVNQTGAASRQKVEEKQEKLNDVVQKMVVEYVVNDEPLQNRLDLQHLPALLQTELRQQGIQLNFGYWVVSGRRDTVAAHNLTPLKTDDTPHYRASLFPNDIFEKTDYLGLYFPDSKSYALKSLWGMLGLSALFTLVIIATFGTTIHIIYKQKKLSEMKNDFINNMTHEFKTPIATISLATDSITNPKVFENPEKVKYYTGIIRAENKRMNAQVENVLQIAKLEKNEFRMNLQPTDVHALIVRAIEGIRLQVEQRLGQVHVQLNALQHELRSDEVHLFNVICNLLDNANKYSPTHPDIQLTTRNVAGGLVIAVEDKGIGMSKETQQRVFEKFYRVPTGNLHNVKGFGLGLSYVKAIVQAHRGDIRLKSELGKGSRFEVFLPIS